MSTTGFEIIWPHDAHADSKELREEALSRTAVATRLAAPLTSGLEMVRRHLQTRCFDAIQTRLLHLPSIVPFAQGPHPMTRGFHFLCLGFDPLAGDHEQTEVFTALGSRLAHPLQQESVTCTSVLLNDSHMSSLETTLHALLLTANEWLSKVVTQPLTGSPNLVLSLLLLPSRLAPHKVHTWLNALVTGLGHIQLLMSKAHQNVSLDFALVFSCTWTRTPFSPVDHRPENWLSVSNQSLVWTHRFACVATPQERRHTLLHHCCNQTLPLLLLHKPTLEALLSVCGAGGRLHSWQSWSRALRLLHFSHVDSLPRPIVKLLDLASLHSATPSPTDESSLESILSEANTCPHSSALLKETGTPGLVLEALRRLTERRDIWPFACAFLKACFATKKTLAPDDEEEDDLFFLDFTVHSWRKDDDVQAALHHLRHSNKPRHLLHLVIAWLKAARQLKPSCRHPAIANQILRRLLGFYKQLTAPCVATAEGKDSEIESKLLTSLSSDLVTWFEDLLSRGVTPLSQMPLGFLFCLGSTTSSLTSPSQTSLASASPSSTLTVCLASPALSVSSWSPPPVVSLRSSLSSAFGDHYVSALATALAHPGEKSPSASTPDVCHLLSICREANVHTRVGLAGLKSAFACLVEDSVESKTPKVIRPEASKVEWKLVSSTRRKRRFSASQSPPAVNSQKEWSVEMADHRDPSHSRVLIFAKADPEKKASKKRPKSKPSPQSLQKIDKRFEDAANALAFVGLLSQSSRQKKARTAYLTHHAERLFDAPFL